MGTVWEAALAHWYPRSMRHGGGGCLFKGDSGDYLNIEYTTEFRPVKSSSPTFTTWPSGTYIFWKSARKKLISVPVDLQFVRSYTPLHTSFSRRYCTNCSYVLTSDPSFSRRQWNVLHLTMVQSGGALQKSRSSFEPFHPLTHLLNTQHGTTAKSFPSAIAESTIGSVAWSLCIPTNRIAYCGRTGHVIEYDCTMLLTQHAKAILSYQQQEQHSEVFLAVFSHLRPDLGHRLSKYRNSSLLSRHR